MYDLNFWSLRWLSAYVSLQLGLIKFSSLLLNIKYESDDFMILPKFANSFTVYGENKFLKSSVLTLKFWKSEKCVVNVVTV